MVDLSWTVEYSWIIIVAPLISFVLCFLMGRHQWEGGALMAIAAVGVSSVLSLLLFIHILIQGAIGGAVEIEVALFNWIGTPQAGRVVTIGLLLDNLGALMLLLVSFLSLLIVIYSVGYMHLEPSGKQRYYGEVSLFIAGMLGTVSANNFLQLLIFWEIMGLCSYLLIGFWFYKPEAAAAAKKAFLVTRVGDVMFLAGILALFIIYGSFNILEIRHATEASGTFPAFLADRGLPLFLGFWIPILIFGGAVGKSAQFPLHGWLPDAMEGPTTVSALIHAATMVKGGVYLVARSLPLFTGSTDAALVVAAIGGFTALFAATHALAQNDIKRVLAYSTISQLGYMFLGLGAAGYALALAAAQGTHDPHAQEGYSASLFHLMNHAFFKALLFLGAGSVIHAVHTNDMRLMGGLRKAMPITSLTMLLGALSIAGIPPLSGFWSKDAVLESTFLLVEANPVFLGLWVMGIATAFLTAFYMFRLWYMTFHGSPRWAAVPEEAREQHKLTEGAVVHESPPERSPAALAPEVHGGPHESPPVMTSVLGVLALFAVGSGLLIFPLGGFTNLIFFEEAERVGAVEILIRLFARFPAVTLTATSLLVALAGIGLATLVYARGRPIAAVDRPTGVSVRRVLERRYYFDDFYNGIGTHVVYGFARANDWFDRNVVDGLVNGIATATLALARGFDFLDRRVVDGAINSLSLGVTRSGWKLRTRQTGVVQNYVAIIVLGLAIIGVIVIVLLPLLGVR
jgi:NADH-quinone oxidoreductase subunit L